MKGILHAKLKNIKYLILIIWLVILALSVLVRGLPKADETPARPAVAGEVMEGRSILVMANGRLDRILEL